MMIEKSGSIELRDISIAEELTPEMKEMAAGMVRVKHLYRSALKIAVTQMEILDEEFASLYDHSPIHHIEHRIKTLESAAKKLKRRGYDLTIDNIYAHIQDMAGVRVICNYLDDIYYLRGLLTRTESFRDSGGGLHQDPEALRLPQPAPDRGGAHRHLRGDAEAAGGDPAAHHRHGHVGQPGARAAV